MIINTISREQGDLRLFSVTAKVDVLSYSIFFFLLLCTALEGGGSLFQEGTKEGALGLSLDAFSLLLGSVILELSMLVR